MFNARYYDDGSVYKAKAAAKAAEKKAGSATQ